MAETNLQKIEAAEAFNIALAHHQNGRLAEAEHYYRVALSRDAHHSDSLNNLGAIAGQFGHFQIAADLIGTALKHAPANAQFYYNRASALLNLNEPDRAAQDFICGLILDPAYFEVITGLGAQAWHQGRFEAAERSFHRAVSLNPHSGDAQLNFANALARRGETGQALVHFHKAEAAGLNTPLFTLGALYHQQGDFTRAEDYYRRALVAFPNNGQIGLYLADLLVAGGQLPQAVHFYRFALATAPDDIGVWSKLSQLLFRLRGYEAADAACRWSLRMDPMHASGYLTRAKVLNAQQKLDDALFNAQCAVALSPDGAEISQNFAASLSGFGFISDAVAWTRHATQLVPEIDAFKKLQRSIRLYDPEWRPPAQARDLKAAPAALVKSGRIRLGYVSSDFLSHPVARCILPLLEKADRRVFHVSCFANVDQPDSFTEKLKALADDWIPITGLSDEAAAARIRENNIDIAIFLAGSFDQNRPEIASYRAAPVQVSLHDGMSSELPGMDYLISDPILTPRPAQIFFSERLARLPHLIMQLPIENAPDPGPLPVLRSKGLSLGSFNNPTKINSDVLALWGSCLRAVPSSTLTFVYRGAFDSQILRRRILRTLDIDPSRIIFTSGSRRSYDEHLALYRGIDLSLDPFPFSGYTVSFESLSMGVPVMTLPGVTMGSRWTYSLLDELQLNDFVARDHTDFVRRVAGIQDRVDRLIQLRQSLPGLVAASNICRTDQRVRHFERLFKAMYNGFGRRRNGQTG